MCVYVDILVVTHFDKCIFWADEECMFLHGGRTQKAEVLNDTFLLNTKTGEWKKVKALS
jgi:hypothetical protein